MDQKTTQSENSQTESPKSGGCCGSNSVTLAADVKPVARATASRSKGCCCSKT
jgi:hypothetical protein